MAKRDVVNIHIMFWRIVYERLVQMKMTTNKPINWLVNIFLDERFEELTKRVKVADKEQAEEIKAAILQLANDVQAIRRNLSGACRNFDMICRNSNIARKKINTVRVMDTFKITPDMRRKPILQKDIQSLENSLYLAERGGRSDEVINNLKRELFAAKHGLFVEDLPENLFDTTVQKTLVPMTEDEIRDAFIDVAEAKQINAELLASSEKLAEILTQLM